jgi:hypothetical protein
MGLLLDRLTPGWKQDLLDHDRTVQEQLALAAGDGPAGLAGHAAERQSLERAAGEVVERLGRERRAMADSILNAPGLTITLDPSGLSSGKFNWCGFDPQNLLQDPSGRLHHLRFLRLCGDGNVTATISVPAVEDPAGPVHLVLPETDRPALRAGDQTRTPDTGTTITLDEFTLQAGGLEITAPRATVTVRPGSWHIRFLPKGT